MNVNVHTAALLQHVAIKKSIILDYTKTTIYEILLSSNLRYLFYEVRELSLDN